MWPMPATVSMPPANGGVFCYDLDDRTLTPMSKGDGLSDVGIATLAYDDATQALVVAYNNSNIDIISEGRTYNLSDIKRSEISGDKNIYHIRFAWRQRLSGHRLRCGGGRPLAAWKSRRPGTSAPAAPIRLSTTSPSCPTASSPPPARA